MNVSLFLIRSQSINLHWMDKFLSFFLMHN